MCQIDSLCYTLFFISSQGQGILKVAYDFE